MSILFAIQEDGAGMWSVWRDRLCLKMRRTLAQAITEGRQLAREMHERAGVSTCVDLITPEGSTRLGQYAHGASEKPDASAVA